MDDHLHYLSNKKGNGIFKRKPFWNNNLTMLWKEMKNKEHIFVKQRGSTYEKHVKKEAFLYCRRMFDRTLRQTERLYRKKLLHDIDGMCSENPIAFLDQIKKLGPRNRNEIPMQVYVSNELVNDRETVLSAWATDVTSLYNRPNRQLYDNAFYEQAINFISMREQEMSQPYYTENGFLNVDITLSEVEGVLNRLKINKASGYDCIPNECLQKHDVKLILFNLFKIYFNCGRIPSAWHKAIICPIPKSAAKDPHMRHAIEL